MGDGGAGIVHPFVPHMDAASMKVKMKLNLPGWFCMFDVLCVLCNMYCPRPLTRQDEGSASRVYLIMCGEVRPDMIYARYT